MWINRQPPVSRPSSHQLIGGTTGPAKPRSVICFRSCDFERVDVGTARPDRLWPTEISLSRKLTPCYLTVSRAVLSTFFAHGALIDGIAFLVCVAREDGVRVAQPLDVPHVRVGESHPSFNSICDLVAL
jgi:hypothetical protein